MDPVFRNLRHGRMPRHMQKPHVWGWHCIGQIPRQVVVLENYDSQLEVQRPRICML